MRDGGCTATSIHSPPAFLCSLTGSACDLTTAATVTVWPAPPYVKYEQLMWLATVGPRVVLANRFQADTIVLTNASANWVNGNTARERIVSPWRVVKSTNQVARSTRSRWNVGTRTTYTSYWVWSVLCSIWYRGRVSQGENSGKVKIKIKQLTGWGVLPRKVSRVRVNVIFKNVSFDISVRLCSRIVAYTAIRWCLQVLRCWGNYACHHHLLAHGVRNPDTEVSQN